MKVSLSRRKQRDKNQISRRDGKISELDIVVLLFSEKFGKRPNLRFLSLGDVWIKNIPKQLNTSDISKISYIRLFQINTQLIKLLGKYCVQLRGLRIGEPYSPPTITDTEVIYISSNLHNLTQLFLRDQHITECSARAVVRNLRELQTLDLGNNKICKKEQRRLKLIYKGNMIWF